MLCIAACAALIFIVFTTLSRVGMQPEISRDPFYERFDVY
jgi:hypothetical protein